MNITDEPKLVEKIQKFLLVVQVIADNDYLISILKGGVFTCYFESTRYLQADR